MAYLRHIQIVITHAHWIILLEKIKVTKTQTLQGCDGLIMETAAS